jgi:transcriptional regulator with XRE-family HTH domain
VEPKALRAVIAENIRGAARRKRVTINALADFAAVSRAQMFNVLGGTSSPTIDWLAKVAAALEVEPWQLLSPRSFKKRSPSAPR